MKCLLTASALLLSVLGIATPAAHADSYLLSLQTGAVTDTLVDTPILNGDVFTYTNTTVGLLGAGGVLSSSTSVFTATYADVLGTLGVLNVTDVCTHITILGPETPCQAFAFSFTNLTLGDASVVAAVGAVADVNLNVATLDIAGGSVAGGSGIFNFTPAPTPEPESLYLLATGLLGTAGAVRRRMSAAASGV